MFGALPREKLPGGPESTTISVVLGPVGESIETTVPPVPPLMPPPMMVVSVELPPQAVQWMYDADGRALFHITTPQFRNIYPIPGPAVSPTGALNHVALDCSDFDDMIARLDRMGAQYRASGIDSVRLKQIFIADPNQVMLELNFRGE